MAKTISKHPEQRNVRVAVLIPAVLFLIIACQTGQWPVVSGQWPVAPVKFTTADYAKHAEQLRARIKKALTPPVAARASGGSPRATSPVLGRSPVGVPRSARSSPGEALRAEGSSRTGVRILGGDSRRALRRASRSATASAEAAGAAAAAQFSIVIQPPFVVIGDETKEEVEQHAEGTVKWAVERLKQDFFQNDPKNILDIWLFKDKESYEKNTLALFGETPTTPYGYYSSTHKALIMNIETGGGTLVHEIVHPFVEANFPACPPWLNEGLGSLYEQCGDVKGHIHGFPNWRLPGLQQAIKLRQVPSFKTLTAMDATTFYNEDRGTNYAQARYLCYYLQEKGLLLKFYREFHARQKEDRGGFETLKKVLVETDMDAFKTKWEKYVLALRQGYELTVD